MVCLPFSFYQKSSKYFLFLQLNVLIPPDVTLLKTFKGKPNECVSLHHFECPCLFGFSHQSQSKKYKEIFKKYSDKVREVASREEFNNREVSEKLHRCEACSFKADLSFKDFTINIQPFTKNVKMPELPNGDTDFSYMSMDCFHFSQKGYALATNALWNNMLEKEGNKTENWQETFKTFRCPTKEMPFLATNLNSM
jgi:hypothetical protein